MNRSIRDLDESDVRVRPGRRGSRPRTKERPAHRDAVPARVVSVDRGRWRTVVDVGGEDERTVTAMRARELGRSPIVPGDLVGLVGDVCGRHVPQPEGAHARRVDHPAAVVGPRQRQVVVGAPAARPCRAPGIRPGGCRRRSRRRPGR